MIDRSRYRVLYHHGVKGMKWGIRKNLNSAGKKVKRLMRATSAARTRRQISRSERIVNRTYSPSRYEKHKKRLKKLEKVYNKKTSDLTANEIKTGEIAYSVLKNLAISAVIGGTGAAIYGLSTPVLNETRYTTISDGTKVVAELVNGVVKSKTKIR